MADRTLMITVLMVDDDMSLLDDAHRYLGRDPEIRLETALSGEEALRLFQGGKPDVIVSGFDLPGMNGIELFRTVRERNSEIPFIIVTEGGHEDVVIDALNAGVDFYLRKGGEPTALFAELSKFIRQIMNCCLTERSLRQSENLLRTIIDHLPDATFAIDTNGRVVAWNHAIETMTGVPSGEMIGKGDYEYAIPFYGTRRPVLIDMVTKPEEGIALYNEIKHNGHFIEAETMISRPGGKERILWVKATLLVDDNGNPEGAIESIRDISENRLQTILREGEAKYRQLVDHARIAIVVAQEGKIRFMNPFGLEVFGLTPESVAGMPMEQLIHPDDRSMVLTRHEQRLAGKTVPSSYTFRIIDRNGSVRSIEINVIMFSWEGKPATLNLLFDITERRNAEALLREREAVLRSIFTASPVGIAMIAESTILEVNDTFCVMTGYAPGELINQRTRVLYDDDTEYTAVVNTIADGIRTTGTGSVETHWRRKDGSIVDILLQSTLIDPASPESAQSSVAMDITEQNKAAAELGASEQRFKDMAEMLPQTIFEADTSGNLTYVNRQTFPSFGFTPEDYRRGINILDALIPEDRDRARENIGRIMEEGRHPGSQYTAQRKDGTTFPVMISSAPIMKDGKTTGLRGFVIDISEIKKAEMALKRANERLNLMNSITRHDILNQITVLQGFLALGKEKTFAADMLSLISKLEMATETIRRQIGFTRDYQDIGAQSPGWFSVEALIRTAASMLPMAGVALTIDVEGIAIFADPLVEKVFYNLLENALRYGETLTTISISARPDQDDLIIMIGDDGIGIPVSEKKRVFNRGYGKNTGYGLFLAREILSITGMTIQETGAPESGACFSIRVPAGEFRHEIP
ncbi:MAG: PAS domain S-box protein [Methanomicrobiaceae archaeon]|nr:PAS domain S-box protein [Methanomicrobiaceae archaeon]